MKKLLIAVFVIAGFIGVKAFLTSLQMPAEGMVTITPTEVIVVEEVTVMEEPVMVEEVVVEEVVMEETFMPLDFNGKGIKAWAAANGGTVFDVSSDKRAAALGGKKGVKVGSDIYFKGKKGMLYVYHNGEILTIDNITEGSAFCDGYEAGYIAGYCYKVYGCLEPLTPLCPLPDLGEDNYKGGYNKGFLDGLNDQN